MRKTGAMQKGILTAVFLLIMTSLAVASTNVSGQISTNTTWTTTGSPYIVTGDVRVYATSSTPVLTIQAGVTVKFNSGTGLYIGNGASTGKLTANGTSSSRITFTANSSTTKGFYKGIFFDTGAAVTSSLQYADISYGGGGTNAGEVVVNGVSPTISNCTITYSSTKGIYLQNGAAPVMASNTVNNCSSFPLSFDPTCRIASVTSITGATTNTPNQIEVRAGDLTGSNDTWANLSIPYYLPGLVRVFGTTSVTTKLTVSAGANLRFNIGAQLKIGNETNPALKSALYAVGTSSSIIKFTSNKATPAAGDWGGIQLLGGVDNAATSIQYATVEYAGSSGWGIGLFSCNPQIKNTVTVRYSSGIGILMNNSASTLQTVTLANNTGYAVRIEGTAGRAANLSSLTFTSNGKNAVEYVRSDIRETAETLSYLGTTSVYEIPNGISVHGQSSTAAKLTVAGGVNLKFLNGSGLFVGGDDPIEPGILVVSGTSSLPVIMEGSAATAGNWGGLGLYDSVVDASTTIDYATIRYAGGGILIANCSPTIRNSTISNSSENGITIQGAASPTMTSCTSRNNGGYPLEVSAEVRMSGITGMTCTANGTNMIHFFGRQVEGSGDTYPNCGVPYMVEGSILVRGEEGESPKLKLQPGVEMRFSEYESLIIGDGSDEPGGANHGSLEAIGTSSQRIILRSRAMASNMWNGLYIDNASIDASTRLSYVTISEAGQDGTALYISGANPTIDHTTINGATQYGITLWESAPTVSSTTITNAGVAPILASANSRLKNFSSITFDSGAFVDYSGGHFSGTAETLPGFSIPYRVSGWIDIYGDLETAASLTLAAGAKLHFMPATGINVGSWNDASQAIFKCTGTGSAHVELTGDDGGSWDAVDFVDGSVNGQTRLDYTTIDMAGTGSNRAVYVRNCSPIFSHCSFLHSPGYGIWSESSPELQVAQSTFDSNGGYPISIDQSTDIAGIIDYTFTNNNPDEIEMRGGSVANRISTDTHWTVAKSPYNITGDVVVAGLNESTATLTIDPGVVVRFEDGADLRIGLGSDEHGRLVAEGTAGSPITFTAKNGTNPGSCVGLIFDDAADDSSVLQNVFIEYAGGNGYLGAITIHSANPTITSCEIHYSGTSGIQLEENAAPAITGLNVTNCAQYVFSFDSTCRIASIEQVQGDSSNGTNMIEARSGDLTGTNEIWHKQGVPYLVRNRIMVYGTETTPVLFQIDAGTILRMMPDGHIVIGSWDNAALQGAFSAVGTEGEPIIFTSEDAAPPAGRWPGLIFLGGTVGAQTIIQHAVIEYGGAEGAPARMYNSNPTISHTVIRGSNQMGVLMSNSAAVLTDVTVTESAGYAILIEGEYGRAAGLSAITMTGNGIDAVEYSRDVREDLEILPYLGGASNYDIPNGLWIHGNETTAAKLQIAGGSTLRFLNNNGISVGIDSDIEPGILEVAGTETMPVWMKGPAEDPNSWAGIYFDSSTVDAETIVSYANIINAGINGMAVDANRSNPTLDHVTINGAAQYCMSLWESAPIVMHSVLTGAGTAPILASPNCRLKGFSDITFDSGAYIDYSGGRFSGEAEILPGFSIPYRVSGWISVFGDLENAASLTIAAGAKLHFMPATGINVGSWDDASKAILKCAGTATAPVELTGHDGGTWEAVNFLDGSVASQTRLDYTTIDMAGVSSNNAVFIRNCSPIFSHCTIMHSSGYGMWTENSPALQVADSIFDSNGNFPISIDIMTNAAGITGSTFTNNNPDGIEQRGGDITQNVHLVYMEQPYILNGQVTIRGTTETPAVLTIDPGVIIKQNTTGGFAVGLPSGEKGAIIAEGTAEHPIIFTTNLSQAPGAWMGFEFYTASPVSSFKHCTIEYAGNANERSIVLSHGAATFEDCIIRNGLGCGLVLYDPGTEVTLTNCTFDHFTTFGVELGDQTNLTMTGGAIHNCSTYGVSIWRAAPTISNVTISSCGIAPLRANPNSRLKHIESLTFDTGASIEYGGGRISGEDEVFPGLPFQIFGSLQVAGTVETPTTLRITAGAKLRFTDNSILLVGSWTDERGILNCQGTSSAPILFDSVNGNPGTWVGLQFLASAIQSELHFTTISHAGQSNNRSIWINGSSPLFSDCTIANGTGYGAFLETGGTPAIINCVFQSNTSYPISLDINVNANLAGNTFTGNNPDTVEYRGGVMTADRRLKNAGAAYDFNGTIEVRGTIGSPAILTIDPGVTIRFSAGQNLIIGGSTSQPGALIAIGTATQPIVFTGQTQASGSWGGIVLNDGTVDSITHIAFCQIERAIKGIAIESGANGCAITDSQISFCSEYGVSVFEADSTTLERVIVNDLAESGSGLCFTSGTNIRVLNCAILRSGVYAIKIIDSGVDITNSIVDTAQTGVYLSASSASLQTVTIKNVIGMPISIDIQSSLPACTNITLVDNDFNSIEHRGGHASNASHLFYVNYPYLLKNSINCDASLTIDPGVILRLNSGVEIDADAIAAVGSVDNQIIITANSAAPSPGYWSDLKIGPSQTPSDLEYVTIEYGGSLSWSIIAHGSVAFHNCTIRFSGSDGVLASNGCEFINSTIIQNNRDGIQLSGMDNIIQYCTISNNLRDGVESIDGAHKIDRSMIMGNSGVGIRVIMPGTKLAVHYSTIRGNLQGGAASTIHNNTDINGTLRRYQCVNGLSQWLMV